MSCQGRLIARQQLAEVNKYIERHSSITEDRIHVQLLEQQNKEYEQQLNDPRMIKAFAKLR